MGFSKQWASSSGGVAVQRRRRWCGVMGTAWRACRRPAKAVRGRRDARTRHVERRGEADDIVGRFANHRRRRRPQFNRKESRGGRRRWVGWFLNFPKFQRSNCKTKISRWSRVQMKKCPKWKSFSFSRPTTFMLCKFLLDQMILKYFEIRQSF